jgi:hypothetical protein
MHVHYYYPHLFRLGHSVKKAANLLLTMTTDHSQNLFSFQVDNGGVIYLSLPDRKFVQAQNAGNRWLLRSLQYSLGFLCHTAANQPFAHVFFMSYMADWLV